MANANIFAQYMRPAKSVADYTNEMDSQDANTLNLQHKRMEMEKSRQTVDDERATRSAYAASGGDRTKYKNALTSLGRADKVQALDSEELEQEGKRATIGKTVADTARTVGQTQETAQSMRYKAADRLAQSVVNVQSPQDAVAYIDQGIQEGVFPAEKRDYALQQLQSYPSIDAWKQAQIQSAIPVLERFKKEAEMARAQLQADTSIKTTGMNNETSRFTNAATIAGQAEQGRLNRGVQLGIAGMADRRAGERLAFDKTKEVPEKPLNDAQSKALLFGSRMADADSVINSLQKAGTSVSVPGSRAGYGVGATINALSSAQQQQLDQAKRNFINATLRRESGAVISESEFENAEKQYFPQIGDKKDTIAQKSANRKMATDGILMEVPETRRGSLPPASPLPMPGDKPKADNGMPADVMAVLRKYGG